MRLLCGRMILQRCLSGRRSTTGNRVYLARVPWVQIPFSAPIKHLFYGCFFILLWFYAEFSIFIFAKLCTRMRVYSERYFYIAVPCKALADITNCFLLTVSPWCRRRQNYRLKFTVSRDCGIIMLYTCNCRKQRFFSCIFSKIFSWADFL